MTRAQFFLVSILFMTFTSFVSLFSQQFPHIPAGHDDTDSICWGYAVARAFQNKGHTHAECPASTVLMYSIPATFFDEYSWNINNVQAGDIIKFDGHVAYVSSKTSSTTTGITLAQAEYEGGPIKTGYTLQQTIDGVESELIERGSPTGYYVLTPEYELELENYLGDESSSGQVKLDGDEENSPYTYDELHWNSDHTLYAVMHEETHNGYKQIFDEWKKDGSPIGASLSESITLDWNSHGYEPNYVSHYLNEYDLTFQNAFTGVSGNPGDIEVAGNTESSPHETSTTESIQAEAIDQTYNGIAYTFDEWDDEDGTNPRTFDPDDNDTYTALFTGTPISLYYYNLEIVGDPGDFVTLDWDEHPNDNVSYEIWRKVKDNGIMGDPELIATRSHSTTSYTDYEYKLTSGYTEDLLYYDVRAYYSTEDTYSDPEWLDAFGEPGPAKRSILSSKSNTVPNSYSISNFPNPFNPTTTISFSLAKHSHVILKVYNISGQEIASLLDGSIGAGVYEANWESRNGNGYPVAGGIYIAKLVIEPDQGENFVLFQKMLLAK